MNGPLTLFVPKTNLGNNKWVHYEYILYIGQDIGRSFTKIEDLLVTPSLLYRLIDLCIQNIL